MSAAASIKPTIVPAVPKEAHKLRGSGCDIYGNQRLAVAQIVKGLLEEYVPNQWFIESGTLLGAYRSGKFIPHDDDFDIGVVWESDPVAELGKLNDAISNLLPAPLSCRVVSSYCDKIEVFDPTEGIYTLVGDRYGGADYHHVTVDLQAYTVSQDKRTVFPLYRASPFRPWKVPYDAVFPCEQIELEGVVFKAPAQVKDFLESIYGSLEKDAVYDSETGKYVLPAPSAFEIQDGSGVRVVRVDSEYDCGSEDSSHTSEAAIHE